MQGRRAGALFALAIAAGTVTGTGTALAAGSCGQPATAALYRTRTVPAVPPAFQTEAQWSRSVQDAPGWTDVGWSRRLSGYGYTDYGWTRHVVDSPAVPGTAEVSHIRYEWTRTTTHSEDLWGYLVVDRPAGTETIHHDAVTHTEYQWQLEQSHALYEWSRQVLVSPEVPAVPGTPEQGVWQQGPLITAAWDEVVPATYTTVVDVPEHTEQRLVTAAYDETVVLPDGYAYVTKHGKVTWGTADWNNGALPIDEGWQRDPSQDRTTVVHHDAVYTTVTVPATYTTVVDVPEHTVHHDAVYGPDVWVVTQPATPGTPAVPAVYTTETQWSQTSPGPDWSRTDAAPQPLASTYEYTWAVDQPAAGWVKTGAQRTVEDSAAWDEVVQVAELSHWVEVWSEGRPAGDLAWELRGQSRPLPSTVEQQSIDGDTLPSGDGWELSGQEKVVDVAAVEAVPEVSHDEYATSTSATLSPWAGEGDEGALTGVVESYAQDSYVALAAPWVATGTSSQAETAWTQDAATAPEGAGWTLSGEQVVHDAVVREEVAWVAGGSTPVGPGWTATGLTRQGRQTTPGSPETTVTELVRPATPATAACTDGPAGTGGSDQLGSGTGSAQRPTGYQASAVPAHLAFTGADTGDAGLLGALLLGGGLGLTLTGRRLAAIAKRRCCP